MKRIIISTLLTLCWLAVFSQDFSKDYQRLYEANKKLVAAVIPPIDVEKLRPFEEQFLEIQTDLNLTFCAEEEDEYTPENFQNIYGFKKQLLKWLKTSNDIINEIAVERDKCNDEITRLVDSYDNTEMTAAKVYECDRKKMSVYQKYAGVNGTIRLLLGKWNNHIKSTLLPQAVQLSKTNMKQAAQIQKFINFAYSNEVSSLLQTIQSHKACSDNIKYKQFENGYR